MAEIFIRTVKADGCAISLYKTSTTAGSWMEYCAKIDDESGRPIGHFYATTCEKAERDARERCHELASLDHGRVTR